MPARAAIAAHEDPPARSTYEPRKAVTDRDRASVLIEYRGQRAQRYASPFETMRLVRDSYAYTVMLQLGAGMTPPDRSVRLWLAANTYYRAMVSRSGYWFNP
jgi:hypothetical protein